ncbi:hypothetical protein EVA_07995 [gut metagenome]|uniref:Uncharacterized protein n=1 Tax=gut metagenome TaxID=749906 RepID=J9CUK1_9ZZZZ
MFHESICIASICRTKILECFGKNESAGELMAEKWDPTKTATPSEEEIAVGQGERVASLFSLVYI